MMAVHLRSILFGSLALVCLVPPPVSTAQGQEATISAAPGTLVRWVAPGATHCSMKARIWAALEGTCYYPIDLLEKPGPIRIAIWGSGPKEFARISVEPNDYGTEEITLPDIPQANPTREDLKRDAGDQLLLGKIWRTKEGPAQFTLPLGEPVRPMSVGKSFGVKRVYNGKLAEQAHMGSDYDSPVGSPILAVGSGKSSWPRNCSSRATQCLSITATASSACTSTSRILKVQVGQEVKKGETLGREGSTGRATAHLWFGVRWRDARIDPKFVLEDPARIPAVKRVSP